MTKREEILQAIRAQLITLTSVPPASIFRSRVSAFLNSEAPAVLLTWDSDTPTQDTVATLSWKLVVKISVLVREEEAAGESDSIVEEIHGKIMLDPTIDGLVIDLQPGNVKPQRLNADGDAEIITSDFTIVYRTPLQNLTA